MFMINQQTKSILNADTENLNKEIQDLISNNYFIDQIIRTSEFCGNNKYVRAKYIILYHKIDIFGPLAQLVRAKHS